MQGSQALDILMARLGNRTNPDTRAIAALEMALAQQTVLEMGPYIPWFCIDETVTLDVVADNRRIVMPDGFLREVDEAKVWVIDEDGNRHRVVKKDWDDLITTWGYEAEGELAKEYALLGDYLHLFPIPTVARVAGVVIPHYKRQAVAGDNATETTWLKNAPDLLIAATGRVMARTHLKDEVRTLAFATDLNEAYTRLERFDVARTEAGRDRSMG